MELKILKHRDLHGAPFEPTKRIKEFALSLMRPPFPKAGQGSIKPIRFTRMLVL
jgi:hypothetical protein